MKHLVRRSLGAVPALNKGDVQIISNALDHFLISQGGVDLVGHADGLGLWTFSHYDADVDIADPHDFFIDVHADWDAWVNFKVESKEDHVVQMYRTPTLVAGDKGTVFPAGGVNRNDLANNVAPNIVFYHTPGFSARGTLMYESFQGDGRGAWHEWKLEAGMTYLITVTTVGDDNRVGFEANVFEETAAATSITTSSTTTSSTSTTSSTTTSTSSTSTSSSTTTTSATASTTSSTTTTSSSTTTTSTSTSTSTTSSSSTTTSSTASTSSTSSTASTVSTTSSTASTTSTMSTTSTSSSTTTTTSSTSTSSSTTTTSPTIP